VTKPGLVAQVVVASVVFSLAASAQDVGKSTDVLLRKATDLYSDLSFERALVLVDQALAKPRNSRLQLVHAYKLRGLCHASLGRYDQASKSFARLLALDPTFRLDTSLSPRIRASFNKVLRRERPRLDVHILPPPAAFLGEPLEFTAYVKDDTLGMIRSVNIWVRRGAAGRYSSVRSRLRGEGETRIRVPAKVWEAGGREGALSWYAMVQGDNRGELKRFGDELHPLVLDVTDRQDAAAGTAAARQARWYERWWVWAIVGGVLAAGTATVVVLTTSMENGGPHDFEVITR
jgi:tetratricopeptide (TPR) repeat protein